MRTRTVLSETVVGDAKQTLITGVLVSALLLSTALAQSTPATGSSAAASAPVPSPVPSPTQKVSPYRLAGSSSNREREFYEVTWGVDAMTVKALESGQMIRFSYRVTDAEKAQPLNDKKVVPYLVDAQAKVKLIVPTMEKVGQLRQSSTPEKGKVYWMVFSNKERYVRPGNRVSVVIGKFHVDGLLVQ
jgi:hypothetical protein